MESLVGVCQPAIQLGRFGAVEVNPRDGGVVGEQLGKVVDHQAFRVDRGVRAASSAARVQHIPQGDSVRSQRRKAGLVWRVLVETEKLSGDGPERISWIAVILA